MDYNNEYLLVDYNKLMKHKDKLKCCIADNPSSPITLEVQPTERCNCNCPHCSSRSNYTLYERERLDCNGNELDLSLLNKLIDFPPENVIVSGSTGDPLMYSKIDELLLFFRSIDTPITLITNGLLLTDYLSDIVLECCCNIRISLDATDSINYSKIHGVPLDSWEKISTNILQLVKIKKERKSNCKIGLGFLTSGEITDDLECAVVQAMEWGVDYIDFRPLQNYRRKTISQSLINYLKALKNRYDSDHFYIWYSHQKYNSVSLLDRTYDSCLASYLYALITPNGSLSLCCNRTEDAQSYYGSLYNCSNWKELLQSSKKRELIQNLDKCPVACRLHTYNIIINDLKNCDMLRDIICDSEKFTRGSWDAI